MAPPTKDAAPATTVDVTIETRSWVIRTADAKLPAAPVVKMNGKDFPAPKDGFTGAHGYRLIAIDAAKDMTDPASVLLNECHYLPNAGNSFMPYEHIYRQMIHSLLGAGDPGRLRVLLVSFGMAAHAPPPPEAYEYLIRLGAGRELQRWETTRTPGESNGDHYIEHPANYVLLGHWEAGYGRGIEVFNDAVEKAGDDAGEAVTRLEVKLHNPAAAPDVPHSDQVPELVHATATSGKAVEVSISSSSWKVPAGIRVGTPVVTITMNGKDFERPGWPASAHGYWVIATDAAKDMTDPESVLLNEYHYLPRDDDNSFVHYEHMYRQMVRALLCAGDPDQQRVFLVSFGMAAHAPPPLEAYEYLIRLGAGSALQGWVSSRAPGENNSKYYIEHPASYVLLGYSGAGYGQGFEAYGEGVDKAGDVVTELSHTLHNPVPAPHGPQPVH